MPRSATSAKDHVDQKIMPPLDLKKWIIKNAKLLVPPVSNKQLFPESDDMVAFVSGGPNTRNDFHVNPTEELFYQLKGDIAVRVRPLDGSKPKDILVREGELFLLPRWVPHRPQRPKGTLGLIIEFPRPEGQLDGLRWFCPECDKLVHEVNWRLKKIDEDLAVIMHEFWAGSKESRTCKHCGCVIEQAGVIKMVKGKVVKGKRDKSSTKVTAATKRGSGKKSVKKLIKKPTR